MMANAFINRAKCVPGLNPNIRGARAHVLLLLADYADTQGFAWPSATTLAGNAGLTEKTVRDSLHVLEDEGVIVAVERVVGRATRWQLMLGDEAERLADVPPAPENQDGVEDVEPRQKLPLTPGNLRAELRKSTTPTPVIPSDRTLKNQKKNHQGNHERRAHRGTRLPAAWKPTAADSTFARGLGLDPDVIAECFRDYWHGKAGAGAIKTSWSGTWRNWCRREQPAPSGRRGNARPSARLDTAAWLFPILPDPDAEPGVQVSIDCEGNPQ
jgi:hypothetical protein